MHPTIQAICSTRTVSLSKPHSHDPWTDPLGPGSNQEHDAALPLKARHMPAHRLVGPTRVPGPREDRVDTALAVATDSTPAAALSRLNVDDHDICSPEGSTEAHPQNCSTPAQRPEGDLQDI